MRLFFIVIFGIEMFAGLYAQSSTNLTEGGPFKVVESMPRFYHPDCESLTSEKEKKTCAERKMLLNIYKNIRYPAQARQETIQGTVVIRFVVDELGFLQDGKIVRDIGGGCGEEALKVVNLMPQPWEPGTQRGIPVKVYYNLPVKFSLGITPGPTSQKQKTSSTNKGTSIKFDLKKKRKKRQRENASENE